MPGAHRYALWVDDIYNNHYDNPKLLFFILKTIKMVLMLSTTPEILQILGQRLRLQRLAQGLAQRDLAQMAGISLGALRKLEASGQSSLATLILAVQALGLTDALEDLFVLKRQSIAQMQQAESARQRQRAPRRRTP